jgi:hypothetical protein
MTALPVNCSLLDTHTSQLLQNLCTEFYWLVDHGFADRTAGMFTNDVVYSAQGVVSHGHSAVQQRMDERAARRDYTSRHTASAFRYHQLSTDQVAAYHLLVVYRDSPVPAVVADVHDLFQYRPGGWQIAQRHIAAVLRPASIPTAGTIQ